MSEQIFNACLKGNDVIIQNKQDNDLLFKGGYGSFNEKKQQRKFKKHSSNNKKQESSEYNGIMYS